MLVCAVLGGVVGLASVAGYCIPLWQLERFSIPNPAIVTGTATILTIVCLVLSGAALRPLIRTLQHAQLLLCVVIAADYAHTVSVVLGARGRAKAAHTQERAQYAV
jgi:hypothetical protein